MSGRVFLTGASGFVGSALLRELLSRGCTVNALVNRNGLGTQHPNLREIRGDLFDPALLDQGVAGCEAIIHLVGIIIQNPSRGITFNRIHFEATRAAVDAAKRAGIRRYIQMSALGVRPNAASEYHRTKWKAEEYVRASGLDWTIFRPSLIHGPGGFMLMEAQWARKKAMPFIAMPYFGSGLLGLGGAGKLQPVFVSDVARAFVDALEKPATIHKTYDLAGPELFTWPRLHEIAAQEIHGKRRLVAPMPVWVARSIAAIGLGRAFGFSCDQVIMSQEDNTGNIAPLQADFGWTPRAFGESLRDYAMSL